VQNGASDIHLRPGDAPTYRVNSALPALIHSNSRKHVVTI
jgi:Tfp pilus assembly pilus retraction ATPase PilT